MIRTYHRRFFRRVAEVSYGLLAGGMGVVLSWVGLQQVGVSLPEDLALAGLGVALVGGACALVGTAFVLVWNAPRARTLSAEREISLVRRVRGFVCADSKALVCSGATTLELDGLEADECQRLNEKYASSVHEFESGPPARAALWWMCFLGCGLQVALVLAALGVTIDHLMPLTLYTSTFVASFAALVFARDRDVRIGLDGVRIGDEFVPYSSLQQLVLRKGRLAALRKDGRYVPASLKLDASLAEALDALVQDRIDAETSGGEAYELQKDETFEAWLRRVRGRFNDTSFREAPASVDRAKELLRDAKVPFQVRVAVAVALSPIDPEYVGETLGGLVHPQVASLKEALELPAEKQDSELRALVS